MEVRTRPLLYLIPRWPVLLRVFVCSGLDAVIVILFRVFFSPLKFARLSCLPFTWYQIPGTWYQVCFMTETLTTTPGTPPEYPNTCTPQISIARYLRKRLRRPYVKAERDQDPNRMIQNQSRMRPRKRGKFCKKGPDYIAITRVQASSNRSISGEMPIREPPAPLRGDQSVRAVGGRVGVGAGCIGSKVGVSAWPPLGGGIKQQ